MFGSDTRPGAQPAAVAVTGATLAQSLGSDTVIFGRDTRRLWGDTRRPSLECDRRARRQRASGPRGGTRDLGKSFLDVGATTGPIFGKAGSLAVCRARHSRCGATTGQSLQEQPFSSL
ncbi:hypothetical protein Nepgr_034005 [Nepenthes gracilis]|uniref:Uncharacterized protein n=1 Tax=Nepenthes gracilis TaxID=150966 RepID=A0AAD3Y984_NEPGR|nr:hypothetical protein Nepgr_034005 [Nepenthes gracilis]